MAYQYIEYAVHERKAFITLNRPEKRNALSHELVQELKDALDQAATDAAVKVIILQATGEAFCAGADLGYLQQLQNFSYDENLTDSNHLKELFVRIYQHPKVIIAQVQGHALAGGCGLATVCDFTFAAAPAKFGYTEVRIGFIPAIVMVFLIRKVGEAHARELLLSGDLISAARAAEMGLVHAVTEPENLVAAVNTFADKLITGNSTQSMQLTKQMIAQVQSLSLENSLQYAAEMNAHARGTDDCKRGIASFLNKEKITW